MVTLATVKHGSVNTGITSGPLVDDMRPLRFANRNSAASCLLSPAKQLVSDPKRHRDRANPQYRQGTG